jgi:hypothetical protein
MTYYDGQIIERNGFTFRVNIERDDTSDAPWERDDGHGPVSEWKSTRRTNTGRAEKGAGEIILHRDGSIYRTYNFAEATRIAKRDGWGLSKEAEAKLAQSLGRAPTRKQIIRQAVLSDFEFLRGWCNDEWEYVGVTVTLIPEGEEENDVETDYGHALWGIESNSKDYIVEVADDFIDTITCNLHDETRERAACANINIATVGA